MNPPKKVITIPPASFPEALLELEPEKRNKNKGGDGELFEACREVEVPIETRRVCPELALEYVKKLSEYWKIVKL
jgi:hypothetical protein